MSTLLKINVKNYGLQTQNFFFFQEPSIYTGGSGVYSNSLYSQVLGNFDNTAGILTFEVNLQYYAGIQQAHQEPKVGESSGYESASRAIDLAPANDSDETADCVTASVNPLGLSTPIPGENVQPGAFRITTPSFEPPTVYNIGSAVETSGGIVLSNFVMANPMNHTDCQPILKYYVQTGDYEPGTVMNFTQSSVNAAICDFTGGHTIINVDLQANGTWNTTTVK